MEGSRAFYKASGVRWRSTTPAATAGRGVGVAVAISCAPRGEDEDDDPHLVFIHSEGVPWAGWAATWSWIMGCCWASLAGLLRQVSQVGSLLFSIFHFLFSISCFNFLFSILFYNSVFNSNLTM
jgi:hypothetical protein